MRFFKIIEITENEYVEKMNEVEEECIQLYKNIDGVVYVQIEEEGQDEIQVYLDTFEREVDNV